MFILGCGPSPTWAQDFSTLEKLILWLESMGISQSALIFTFVLMTMAGLKTYLLQRAKWDSAANSFCWTTGMTFVSLLAGLQAFGLSATSNTCALLSFWAGASLLEGLVMYLRKGGEMRAWPLSLGINAAAICWMVYLKVPSLFVYDWNNIPFSI